MQCLHKLLFPFFTPRGLERGQQSRMQPLPWRGGCPGPEGLTGGHITSCVLLADGRAGEGRASEKRWRFCLSLERRMSFAGRKKAAFQAEGVA